jgi:hypothetical protein
MISYHEIEEVKHLAQNVYPALLKYNSTITEPSEEQSQAFRSYEYALLNEKNHIQTVLDAQKIHTSLRSPAK